MLSLRELSKKLTWEERRTLNLAIPLSSVNNTYSRTLMTSQKMSQLIQSSRLDMHLFWRICSNGPSIRTKEDTILLSFMGQQLQERLKSEIESNRSSPVNSTSSKLELTSVLIKDKDKIDSDTIKPHLLLSKKVDMLLCLENLMMPSSSSKEKEELSNSRMWTLKACLG